MMLFVCSLTRMARQPVGCTVGYTHASSVRPVVRSSDALSGTVTKVLVPLNTSELPNWPVVHVPFATVPLLFAPDESVTPVPVVAFMLYAATKPTGVLPPVVMVKVCPFDVPPPGVGLNTVTVALPAAATSAAVICAVNCAADPKAVERSALFQ